MTRRNRGSDCREQLEAYGQQLIEAGFRVWISEGISDLLYMTYEKDGNYGHLQPDSWGDWSHDMPIPPSRQFGSSMFVGLPPGGVWSVEAAEQVAQPKNWNHVVGTQPNARERTWVAKDARLLIDNRTEKVSE